MKHFKLTSHNYQPYGEYTCKAEGSGDEITVMLIDDPHDTGVGGRAVVIDVESNENSVCAKTSIYLDREQTAELAKLLNDHAERRKSPDRRGCGS